MKDYLRNHYLPEGKPAAGILATEIGSPDGRRFADALWQSTTRSGGLLLVGHEIKVSRADVIIELADTTKAEAWMQYCDQWWLTISDPKLIEGLDIPDAWGVMSPPSGRRKRSMTILKDAPLLKPLSKEAGLLRLLTWNNEQARKERHDMMLEKSVLERRISGLEWDVKNGQASKRLTSDEIFAAQAHAKFMDKIKTRKDKGSRYVTPDLDDFVDAMLDLSVVRSQHQAITYDAKRMLRMIDMVNENVVSLRKVAKELEKDIEA